MGWDSLSRLDLLYLGGVYMKDKKKKFTVPEATLVDFAVEDIITESVDLFDDEGTDNQESW